MEKLQNLVKELCKPDNIAFVTSVITMIIGVAASFVTTLPNKAVRVAVMLILTAAFDLFAFFANKSIGLFIIVVLLSIVMMAIVLFLSSSKETVSRKKLDKLIREFTAKTDYQEPLCIFGGDLDFFGGVVKVPPGNSGKKMKDPPNSIRSNKQFLQLKKMKFKKIHILSVKPTGDNEDSTRLRIGFLKKELGDSLVIKFVGEDECTACPNRSDCLSCEICQKCPMNRGPFLKNIEECKKLTKYYKYRCYNPDTKLRGRVAKDKQTGSPIAAIVTTSKPGKTYILKEYASNTKECTIYQNIWDVWWKKCAEDSRFITACVKEYEDFMN